MKVVVSHKKGHFQSLVVYIYRLFFLRLVPQFSLSELEKSFKTLCFKQLRCHEMPGHYSSCQKSVRSTKQG